jgi:hypothetical protein
MLRPHCVCLPKVPQPTDADLGKPIPKKERIHSSVHGKADQERTTYPSCQALRKYVHHTPLWHTKSLTLLMALKSGARSEDFWKNNLFKAGMLIFSLALQKYVVVITVTPYLLRVAPVTSAMIPARQGPEVNTLSMAWTLHGDYLDTGTVIHASLLQV